MIFEIIYKYLLINIFLLNYTSINNRKKNE